MNMKKLLVVFLTLLSTGFLMSQDLKLDELLQKYLKAIGQEKMANIQTVKMTGKMNQGGPDISLTSIDKIPDLNRVEMEIQGTRIIIVLAGQTGWMINPLTGSFDPQDLSADMINSSGKEKRSDPTSSWDNPFVKWKETGNVVELIGMENLNGTSVYNLKMTFKDKDVINYYLDAATFVIIDSKEKKTVQGQMMEVETRYSDFREVNGVLNPFKTEVLYGGQTGQLFTTDKIEYNLPFDDEIFKKPAINKK
jgi:hypothetical protein